MGKEIDEVYRLLREYKTCDLDKRTTFKNTIERILERENIDGKMMKCDDCGERTLFLMERSYQCTDCGYQET